MKKLRLRLRAPFLQTICRITTPFSFIVLAGCGQAISGLPAGAQITISASQLTVPPGGVVFLAAKKEQTPVAGGKWVVEGYPNTGTVSSNGTYYAPVPLPTSGLVNVTYTGAGGSAAITLKLQNPAVSIASVTPKRITNLITPVLISGSGFVNGSTILVNGTAISTVVVDSNLLAGVVVLPQEVNSTVQLAVSNPNPGGSTSTSLQVPAVFAPISVTASQTLIPAGGTMLFTASRQGSALSGGSWSVTGGSVNGSIDPNGTYHAPATAPLANQIGVLYTHNGATGTGSVSVTNPVPVATAVTPASLTALSTPITISGSGFVSGSTILVNGTAVSTIFVDANHLTGVVVLPQEVNSTVQLAVSNPNPGGSTSTSLQVPAVFAPISVTASQTLIPAGGTMLFTASRQGSALSGGSWSVTGGSVNGSIDPNGTYHAPATAPLANQIGVLYTHNGATGTGSVSVTNPVPVATAVTPASLTALSTPITISGSGFVSGSTILVNGTAVSTIFVDANHLTGVVVLPQEVNSTVQLAVSNPNPGGSTSTSLQVPAVFAPISVTASQTLIPAGGTMLFTASRQGSALSGGSWSVTGGSVNGSIDPNGTYHAPATAPLANQIGVLYTHNGATGTGSVSVTNPVPVATAVTPASLTALSTPITISGSGFVSGSTILVNGTAVSTIFVDANHLTGVVVLPQEVNSTVQLAVSNPNPGGSTSTSLQVPAVFAPISVTASQTLIPAGGTMLFTASRQGSALSGGSWSVTGGSVNGSIDPNGTYHAPATAPLANQIGVLYTHNGATGTGSVSVTNPVPVATAVTPASLTALSTPITISGSGFVSGSTILVNGTAVSTIFVDANHLTGVVVLPQEVNSTVQLAVSNPNPGGSTSTSLQVPAVFAPISVTASQTLIPAGGTMLFTASRQGSALSGGSWSVTGGSVNGSIDPNGTYHAPATAPLANQIGVLYTHNGATGTGSVSVTNPVPVATAVTPASLTALSTPITISGSGFVSGSTILVNGTAVSTIFVDANHLTATVVLAGTLHQTLQVTVSNPAPGATTSNSLSIDTNITPAALAPAVTTPVSTSLNTPAYFREQSDEFVGPFPSWINVQTAFGAVGDGVADDTRAIQNAINSVTDTSTARVIWLPAGTYRITSTLIFAHMHNFSFIGEDPRTTTLTWSGTAGLNMIQTDGSTYFRFSRIGLEGNGVTGITGADIATTTSDSSTYYSTFNELSDLQIHGTDKGITLGDGDAETTVERIHFDHLPVGGLLVKGFNTLNIFVNDSLFSNCGTGITDLLENGSGSYIVSNSYFDHSQVADLSMGNTGIFTGRHNASVGSRQFFYSRELYSNSALVTLQNNTIIDPQITPFQFGNLGPFMLLDNVVRLQDQTLPIISGSSAPSSTKDVFSMGNVYTPNAGIVTQGVPVFQGRVDSYDDSIVPVSSLPDVIIPSSVFVPPNFHRVVFEVGAQTGAAVQAAINLASASGLTKPVVHLPSGLYLVSSTITFPKGSDVQLIGDDVGYTTLQWAGTGTGPTVFIPTSNVSMRYLHVIGPGQGVGDGIQLIVADQPNTQIVVDQAIMQNQVSYGINFDKLEHATAELFSTYAMGASTGVEVTGGLFRAAKESTLGITNHYSGSLQSEGTGTSFDVTDGGKYMIQDNWHDYGWTSARNFKLSGSGTVTEQGGAVYMNSSAPFEIDDFEGNVTLMGLQLSGGFRLAPQSHQTNLLNLGLVSDSATYLPASAGNDTVSNLLDSQYGAHIAQGALPDATWMRSMLAQTRSEYPIARVPLATGASRIRLNRLMVDASLTAIHFQPDTTLVGLSYSIQAGPWNLTSAFGTCVASSVDLNSSHQWFFMSAGDGDVEVVSKDTGKALGFTMSPTQNLILEPITGSYDQRWMVNNQGDGTFKFTNRQTGTLLSLPAPGSCAALGTGVTSWTVTAQ